MVCTEAHVRDSSFKSLHFKRDQQVVFHRGLVRGRISNVAETRRVARSQSCSGQSVKSDVTKKICRPGGALPIDRHPKVKAGSNKIDGGI